MVLKESWKPAPWIAENISFASMKPDLTKGLSPGDKGNNRSNIL